MDSGTEESVCRICYSEMNPVTQARDLISPCKCSGSVKYVHFTCLKMWRMCGKTFGDMGKCEQCHGTYNIPGEKPVYSCLISLSTVTSMAAVYFFVSLVVKKLGETITDIIEESSFEIPINGDCTLYELDKSHYLSCLMFLLSIYKILTRPQFLTIAGYVSSYFTLAVYHISYCRLIFACISIKFIIDVYFETYKLADGLYYYFLNLNWERKYLKPSL